METGFIGFHTACYARIQKLNISIYIYIYSIIPKFHAFFYSLMNFPSFNLFPDYQIAPRPLIHDSTLVIIENQKNNSLSLNTIRTKTCFSPK